jgi:DNA-binding SARP family transcriptional activator
MEFKILGPLEVRRDDRLVAPAGAKQRLLLAVLLLHPNEVVSSDRLIEALWGERPPGGAAKALQMHVSQLRKLLAPDRSILQTRPPGYELRVERGQLDLERFEAAVAAAGIASAAGRMREAADLLHEALALWRGPPLADLSFEDCLQADIARLDALRLGALEDRIEADLALGRHSRVIAELEGLTAEHPLRERVQAQLMLGLYRSGRQAEALEAYRNARRALVDELGLEPGRELKELERQILSQDPALDLPEPERTAPERLVGREREIAVLLPILDRALSGDGAVILLGGEPGIGKSRLADTLALQVEGRARVLVGRCWEAGGAPAYWPWLQALRTYVGANDAEALGDLLPGLPPGPAPESADARFRLFESVAAFLRSAAASEPLALFFDDLHAADAPSLLLLRFLAGQLAGAPVLIVGCYRDTEGAPDLAETLAELSRQPSTHRLSLSGLGSAGVSRLLEITMGATPPEELAARVHAETQGNPLFATEIGRLLASEGLDGADRLPIPEGISDAIGRRLEQRSASCRQVLTLASVVGREFRVEELERVSGLEEDELFRALEEAASARLVGGVPGASGRLRFSHMLVRDAVYEQLPAPRRMRLHRAVGVALEALYAGNPGPHLSELAHHFLEAGGLAEEQAIDYASRAGDWAAARHGYEEAARNYERALSVLETSARGGADRICELLLSLGDVLSRAGDGPEAKRALRRAAAIAEEAGLPDRLARAALAYGGRFGWARASIDPAYVPMLERALAAIGEEESPQRVRLLARLAAARRDDTDRDRRVALAREALEIATRSGDPATLAYALEGHFVASEGPDGTGDGIVIGARLTALGEQIGDRELVFAGHDHRVHTFWTIGDRAGVDVTADALAALADELGQPAQRWHVGTCRTMLALLEGRFDQAEQLIGETLALGERAESWNAAVSHRLALFVLRRAQGRLAEVEETLARSVHEYPALLRFRAALAHLYGELGREQDARAVFDDLLARDLGREHVDAEWLFSMSLLADPCGFLGDEAAAGKLYSLLAPYDALYAVAPVEASFGSIARALGVLAATRRRFDDAERHFARAIEVERGMRAPPWVAHAQHGLATTLVARGDRERALALLDAARATYRALGMATWAGRVNG